MALPLSTQRTVAMLRARKSLGLADKAKRIPKQKLPVAIEREYAAYLLTIVELTRDALRPLFDELPAILASAENERARHTDALRIDANEGKRVQKLVDQARTRIVAAIEPAALENITTKLAYRVAEHNREQLGRQIQAALGSNIFAGDRNLKAAVDWYAMENVALIKDIPTKIVGEVERATTRAIADGTPHPQLAKDLQERFGYGEDRAKLIARDQVGKLYGQINMERQRAIGIHSFIWRTANDDRVRDEHEEREGEVYEYDDPPDGELPGQPVLCRCYGEPVFDDILGEL